MGAVSYGKASTICWAVHSGRWVLGHIEMEDSAPMMGEHDQDEEHLESHCWHDEKIDGHQVPHSGFSETPSTYGEGGLARAHADTCPPWIGSLRCRVFQVHRQSVESPIQDWFWRFAESDRGLTHGNLPACQISFSG